MKRSIAIALLIVVCAIDAEAQGSAVNIGPSVHLHHNSHPDYDAMYCVGLQGYARILSRGWGEISFMGDVGRPVSSGSSSYNDGEWSMSWASGGLSYRTPSRIYCRGFCGYTYEWMRFVPEDRYYSGGTEGLTGGLGVGFAVKSNIEVQVDVRIMAKYSSCSGDEEGYIYRFGVGGLFGL